VGGEFNNLIFHNFLSTGTYTVTIRGYLPNYQGSVVGGGGFVPPPSSAGMTAVTEWNSTTVSLKGAFEYQTALTSVPNYLPPLVTDTSYMFTEATGINDPNIAFWDVSNVPSMFGMFNNAISFNQDLSNWCVSDIPSEPSAFTQGATSWTQPKPVWGTCPAELSFAGYAEIAEDGQGVYIYSEGGSADNMRDVLAQLGVGSTFEWTSPYNPDPNQKYVATLLSENIGIGSSWRFNISTVPRPSDPGAPYFAYWIDEIFIDRPI
jgi:hypothetical protein